MPNPSPTSRLGIWGGLAGGLLDLIGAISVSYTYTHEPGSVLFPLSVAVMAIGLILTFASGYYRYRLDHPLS